MERSTLQLNGAQYSAVEWTRAKLAMPNVVAPALQSEPAVK